MSVLTQHNDNARSGANLRETVLTTANVNARQFGALFTRAVEGQLYAQPLYVPRLAIAGQKARNVVFLATQQNNVYAYDADDPRASAPLWKVNLGPAARTPNKDFGNRFGSFTNIIPWVGITGTPVIDAGSKTMYVVAFTKDPLPNKGFAYHYRLHALDLATGAEKRNSPVEIAGGASGSGVGSVSGVITFDARQHLQRTSLLLSNGALYFGFAGFGDTRPYHGWAFAYDAATLKQRAVLCTTPDGEDGGIWQSGQGMAADAQGNVYTATSNGSFSGARRSIRAGRSYSDSVLKLKLEKDSLRIVDWFAPYNRDELTKFDLDLGNCGPMLVPGTNYLVQQGKYGGWMYVLDRDRLGFQSRGSDSQIVQRFRSTEESINGSAIAWARPAGVTLYVWGLSDSLKAYSLQGRRFGATPQSRSRAVSPKNAVPGGVLSLSANGGEAGTGIVWGTQPLKDSGAGKTVPGIARAFDASDLSRELWNSRQVAYRDDLGNLAKFAPPTIADGKVFMPTFSNKLIVYGLLPKPK